MRGFLVNERLGTQEKQESRSVSSRLRITEDLDCSLKVKQ